MMVCRGKRQETGELEGEVRRDGTHGHDEGIAQPGDGVCDLVSELDEMAIEPSTGNDGDAVGTSNTLLREDTCEDVADDTANGV